jgi:hypothetical protein
MSFLRGGSSILERGDGGDRLDEDHDHDQDDEDHDQNDEE